jgi:large subunit ribosomal protein L29
MKIKELRQKKVADLHKLLKSNREELRSLRFSIGSEQEKNVRKIRDVKKNIAKILTLLNTKSEVESKVLGDKEIKKESSTKITEKKETPKVEEVKKDKQDK